MKYSFSTLIVLISPLLFFPSLQANDCASSALMTTGSPTTLVFDACDNADLANQIDPCNNCSGDAWFRFEPGGTNLVQQNMRFNVEVNGSAEVNITLLYSDSWEESGDPCTWSNAGGSAVGLSRNTWACAQTINMAGEILEFDADGMDGSGKYILLVEKTPTAGTATTVTVTPVLRSTCNAPSNDRCATPLALSSGNGIDPAAPAPNVPSWFDAMKSSTSCATKQRITRVTPGDPSTGIVTTEDHYSYKPIFQPRRYTGNLGDRPFPLSNADDYLENTVYYSFQVSATNSDWNLAIGNSGGCTQEPNNIVAMIFSSLDCNDADNSNMMDFQKFNMDNGVAAGLPSHTFSNLSLTAGQTYYLVIDGTRGSQCDFCLLLYNGSQVNPILPAELNSFSGYNQGRENVLLWETSLEENHDYFSIEKSLDGENFSEIAQLVGQGNEESGQAYTFLDPKADVGINYYRLNMVDIDGSSYYSRSIQVYRKAPEAEFISLFPNPAKNQIEISFTADKHAPAQVELFDLRGSILRQESFDSKPGEQIVRLNLQDLPSGIYGVRFQLGAYVYTQKLIKQ